MIDEVDEEVSELLGTLAVGLKELGLTVESAYTLDQELCLAVRGPAGRGTQPPVWIAERDNGTRVGSGHHGVATIDLTAPGGYEKLVKRVCSLLRVKRKRPVDSASQS